LALILRFTELNEPTLSTITLVLGLIGLFVGGFVAGIKSKTKGWITGGAVGIGFSLFIFLIQYLGYVLTCTFSLSLHDGGFLFFYIGFMNKHLLFHNHCTISVF